MSRKPKYDQRMKPNGMPVELDNWYLVEGKKRGTTGAQLKREVLENYRYSCLRTDDVAETEVPQENPVAVEGEGIPATLVVGE